MFRPLLPPLPVQMMLLIYNSLIWRSGIHIGGGGVFRPSSGFQAVLAAVPDSHRKCNSHLQHPCCLPHTDWKAGCSFPQPPHSQNDPVFANRSWRDVFCVVSGKVLTFLINGANKTSSTHLPSSPCLEYTYGNHKMTSIKNHPKYIRTKKWKVSGFSLVLVSK